MASTQEILKQYEKAPLDELLTQLIANADGVPPERVTTVYIQTQREKLVYPKMKFELGSKYGGYNSRDLKFLSRDEIGALRDSATKKAAALLEAL
jgi:hypothetical protein